MFNIFGEPTQGDEAALALVDLGRDVVHCVLDEALRLRQPIHPLQLVNLQHARDNGIWLADWSASTSPAFWLDGGKPARKMARRFLSFNWLTCTRQRLWDLIGQPQHRAVFWLDGGKPARKLARRFLSFNWLTCTRQRLWDLIGQPQHRLAFWLVRLNIALHSDWTAGRIFTGTKIDQHNIWPDTKNRKKAGKLPANFFANSDPDSY